MSGTSEAPAGRRIDPDCLFCSRLAGEGALREPMIYEDPFFHVSHAVNEGGLSYLGQLLVQTKRHATDLGDLTLTESARLGEILSRLTRALQSTTGAEWTYAYSFLEGYRHVHVFVTARYPNLPEEYVRLDVDGWPNAPRGSRYDVAELAGRLRAAMR